MEFCIGRFGDSTNLADRKENKTRLAGWRADVSFMVYLWGDHAAVRVPCFSGGLWIYTHEELAGMGQVSSYEWEMYQPCVRCGLVRMVQKNRRNSTGLCRSCRAGKQNKIRECMPWHGNFGLDMITPVDEDGVPVLRGKRRCGNLDCVNPKHIERRQDGNGNN